MDRDGHVVFNCAVGGIEQGGFKVKRASVCQFGLLGPTFTLIIPDFAPNAFKEGNFLHQKLAEGEELSGISASFTAPIPCMESSLPLSVKLSVPPI